MVYNGYSRGINADLWDPHYLLPTIIYVLRVVYNLNYMVDWYTS